MFRRSLLRDLNSGNESSSPLPSVFLRKRVHAWHLIELVAARAIINACSAFNLMRWMLIDPD
jgi:hypothetical protein